ncbi:MAG: redox-sensing transcriptional repressor Rex [Thermoanaerobaculaceae bacterium]|jgi:redox-sensing transcriptional repressor|nr:redox-sensing transcriptional repressor Rex [Thermoanaerobaculaceae bacterium]
MTFKRYIPVESISELTINRLSIYLRCLQQLEKENITTISSQELAERFHLNSAQIRKDLAYFGEFGIRGVGYNAAQLREHLVNILGLSEERRVVVVGAGNLGTALSHFSGFNSGGFKIVAVCDADPQKIGKRIPGGLTVEDAALLPTLVKERRIHIGVITVPAAAAQQVFDDLVNAGIQAILNFAPAQLKGHPEVKLKNVDLKINLELLSFFLTHAARLASIT